MNALKTLFFLCIATLFLIGCGTFSVEPVVETAVETPDLDATVEARIALTQTANQAGEEPSQETEIATPTATFAAPTAESSSQPAKFLPDVARFTDEANPEWGAAFCPEAVLPICIRPYAIESLGDEQILISEVWGSGDTFSADANNLNINFRALDAEGEENFGSDCGNTKSEASHYSAGFGYTSRACFRRMESRPTQIEMKFNGARSSFTITWDVGENGEPIGGHDFLINATSVPIDQPFNVGPATITVHSIEELGNALKLDVTIQTHNSAILVASPEWLVIGNAIQFATADSNGIYGEWDEGKMGAYDLVGGEVEAESTQTGTVVLSKASPENGLIISYGPLNIGSKDSIIFTLP